ncbi:MAG: 3-keto-5-aminohexanoate cleavage protein [Arenicellales bacterium]
MSHHPILASAPNGAYKQKKDHSAVPLSLDEIVTSAVDAVKAGVSLLHLHIRDEFGQHSLDADIYRRTIDAIEDQTGDQLIIQMTSEAANRYSPSEQIQTIKQVDAECVSIALRELIQDASHTASAQGLFHWCAERACRAQFILYSETDLLNYFEYLNKDIIPASPHSVLFVLGRYAQNQQSSPEDLLPFLKHQRRLKVPWMVCAFGASEPLCMLDAIKKGGHMRVGFENNLLRADQSVAKNNFEQLDEMHQVVKGINMRLAAVSEARTMLAIR